MRTGLAFSLGLLVLGGCGGCHSHASPLKTPSPAAASALAIRTPEPSAPSPSRVSLSLTSQNPYSTCNGSDLYVVAELHAAERKLEKRLPMNLAIVIDRSGSMEANQKLEYVKQAATFLVRNLQSSDVLGLVIYDDEVEVLSPADALRDPQAVIDKIARLTPRNMTNIEGGLRAGANEVLKHLAENQVNRVVLLSDGLANVGTSDPRALGNLAQSFAERGVAVTSMGVGTDFSEETMMKVAEYGRGNYHFIDNPDTIPGIFAGELRELKAVVALDTRLELDLPEGVTLAEVYGYDDVRSDGRHVSLALGDMFSGDDRRVLLRLTATSSASTLPVSAHVAYRPADEPAKAERAAATLSAHCTHDAQQIARGEDPKVRDEVALVINAKAVDRAMQQVSSGDREAAKQALDARIDAIATQAESSSHQGFKKQVAEMKEARHKLDELDGMGLGSAEVQTYVKGNRAASMKAQKKLAK